MEMTIFTTQLLSDKEDKNIKKTTFWHSLVATDYQKMILPNQSKI